MVTATLLGLDARFAIEQQAVVAETSLHARLFSGTQAAFWIDAVRLTLGDARREGHIRRTVDRCRPSTTGKRTDTSV